jgi:protein ImuA
MVTPFAARAELGRLRLDIARLEGRSAEPSSLVPQECVRRGERDEERSKPAVLGAQRRPQRLRLGIAALDESIGGGLPLANLHEIRTCETRDGAAAAGFILALIAALAECASLSSLVWISEADSRREAGRLYGPGLVALGLDPARIVEVAARTQAEALWSFEAALACSDVGVVVCEMRQASLHLTVTRRCVLKARKAGVTGFLLRLGKEAEPTAAELRFRLAPAPASSIGAHEDGVGRMAWRLALEKNRAGRTGIFTLEWNAHERRFAERGRGPERSRGPQRRRAEERETGWISYSQRLPAAAVDRSSSPADAELSARNAVVSEQVRRAS